MALAQFETGDTAVRARATGQGRFQTRIAARGGPILADEPAAVGGADTGPTPFELLSAGLAACTSMTMRLYAERKQWELPGFEVAVAHSLVPGEGDSPPRDLFTRRISFDSPLDSDRHARLLEIADRCPVHRTLMRGFEIRTETDDAGEGSRLPANDPAEHEAQMEQACAD
ncbi:MAG TPA: OsmC family protein [Allosphingosinicella sp.]